MTVDRLVELLDDSTFQSELQASFQRSLERKLVRYEDERVALQQEIDVTQQRIQRMRIRPEFISQTFPFHSCNLKFLFILEDLLKIIHDKIATPICDVIHDIRHVLTEKFPSIIGRSKIKNDLASRVYSFAKGMDWQNTFQNTLFLGESGCGKSSMAMLMALLFSKSGILVTDQIYQYSPQDLIGQFVGQSAPRMRDSLITSIESVWFLDECYGLTSSIYGQESLTEWVNFSQKYAGCNVMIMAGYKDRVMKEFIGVNEGLSRRIPFTYTFSSLTVHGLTKIFVKELEVRCASLEVKVTSDQRGHIEKRISKTNAGEIMNVAMKTALLLYSIEGAVWDNDWQEILDQSLHKMKKPAQDNERSEIE